MAREIVHIPARRGMSNRATVTDRKIRVAAYCRVSTDHEEQINSFENQVTYYTEYINRNPNYELADIYADEGISGTNTRRRDDFNRMIADCEAGKIDLIITKSISRFARNTQDCLNYSRKLKDLGIGIQFEKEGINTMDSSGELLFTILSSLAQDESRSISENCQWGIRSLFKQGVLHLNTNRFLGYDKDEKGNLVINEEQAAIVRRIYTEFMNGINPDVISRRLRDEGVPGCMGEAKWQASTIFGILRNEKYMGDAILQKTFTSDYLTKKTVKNEGQLEQYHVKGDHEAIIDPEYWDAVQLELERRQNYMTAHSLRTMGRYTDEQPFSNRVLCGECGKVFWRRTWYRLNNTYKVWQCGNRYREKGVVTCHSENLKESDLHGAFVMAWNGILESRAEFTETWKAQAENGNALERFRAKQMLELTRMKPLKEIDLLLVGKVLDYVIVQHGGELEFHFLDGTQLAVEVAE